eukprot:COSAG02_NODE_33158_length_504_cov_1.269136_1_plen_49_part_10
MRFGGAREPGLAPLSSLPPPIPGGATDGAGRWGGLREGELGPGEPPLDP